MMSELFGEFLGTLILILLGNGVVAGVVLPKTKSNSAGWIVITMGWGIAVAVAVFVSGKLSPAHLNPAVTIGVALKGGLPWASVLPYILAQFAGAMLGQILVWLQFKPHYEAEENAGNILATFSTGPAIKDTVSNLISEILGTFAVGTLIVGIGLSLGGTTGYALNPARDLGPRIMHSILPIPNKGDGDWSYAWIPVVGPVIGAALAVLVFSLF
ncbi:MIP/aquaporin family protein [Streptococcus pneumoniae]|uniref:MIP/aquaporin family protein n=1 Tax=Streptococcus pneumoniae TaxID=1313 RepID=UPI0010242B44|nr:MIP/aquaporin family protein [Streptococcus pneumoniae]VFH93440.1 glycerol uptake facilitator protein [Streptococcus pneumoniae]VIZ40426.1 glycerol uptake facilitator protein [Streptococcus pneumoniae]VLC81613.1 glycerol uptake facilitator protein [Streptococcus pneumoniae]VNM77370.1 glycerol uptake facilitator protein [Streptococcus pneumoniae]HEW4510476.1 aquaporin family protein [Streptococcus pneumoniae]